MSERPRNAFLRSLGSEAFTLLADRLTRVHLPLGQVLQQPEERVGLVYFPETALLSVLTCSANGDSVETAMVGTEGALLLLEACGSGVSSASCLAQVDGVAWQAPAAVCRDLMIRSEDFGHAALRLFELQMLESRQSGLCQGLHAVERRLARWLLESSERSSGKNPMPLTQDFIASMLGVQRTTVTSVAVQLQKAGLISYARGKVEITDFPGLEARACECRTATQEHRRLVNLEPLPAAPALQLVSG